MHKNTLPILAIIAFIAPCSTFAATEALQTSDSSAQSGSPQFETNSEEETVRFSLGAEAFYGFAGSDSYKEPGQGGFDIEGVDIYGVNLRFGAEFPQLFGVRWLTPEVFVLAGYGYGSETLLTAETIYNGDYTFEKLEGTSKLQQLSVGAALNFELTPSFALSVSGRLGYGKLKFEFKDTMEYSDKPEDNYSENANDSDGGLIYGIGAGVHWTLAERHRLSLGVEFAGCTAEPNLRFEEDVDNAPVKIEKQRYLFFTAGYSFVF